MRGMSDVHKMTYQEIIDTYGECIFSPVGTSMLPLIKEGTDTVKLVKIYRPLKKYDVILYKRIDGHYVLHRIVKVHRNTFDMIGDNQWSIEKDIQPQQIVALLEGIYHNEKYISVEALSYKFYVRRRILFRWIHRILYRLKVMLKKCRKK